jgi:hypothetical protein
MSVNPCATFIFSGCSKYFPTGSVFPWSSQIRLRFDNAFATFGPGNRKSGGGTVALDSDTEIKEVQGKPFGPGEGRHFNNCLIPQLPFYTFSTSRGLLRLPTHRYCHAPILKLFVDFGVSLTRTKVALCQLHLLSC